MKKALVLLSTLLFTLTISWTRAPSASAELADPILYGWSFNVDGMVVRMPVDDIPPALPGFDFSQFDHEKGTGLITYSFSASKSRRYSVLAFFDHELSRSRNTFINEYGAAVNTPGEGQSWEIDEPGYKYGDIYSRFSNGTLENACGTPQDHPDDASMALGWNFCVPSGYRAVITFVLSDAPPASGFYLVQGEAGDGADGPLYLSSELTIEKQQSGSCGGDDDDDKDWSSWDHCREDEHDHSHGCRKHRHTEDDESCEGDDDSKHHDDDDHGGSCDHDKDCHDDHHDKDCGGGSKDKNDHDKSKDKDCHDDSHDKGGHDKSNDKDHCKK